MKTQKNQAESAKQELADYRDKASRILQSKDRLIASLKEGVAPGDSASFSAELEEARHERDLLREELQQSRMMVDNLRVELQVIVIRIFLIKLLNIEESLIFLFNCMMYREFASLLIESRELLCQYDSVIKHMWLQDTEGQLQNEIDSLQEQLRHLEDQFSSEQHRREDAEQDCNKTKKVGDESWS